MQLCRKTHWKWTGAVLIGKGGGKQEGKGSKANDGDHYFCGGE